MLSILRYSILISIFSFIIMLSFSFFRIHNSVKDITIRATNVIGKEPVPSLIGYYKSIYCVPDDKLKVIWAIGQIADNKALPFLYELQSEFDCDNFSEEEFHYNYEFCYETNKAIKWCSTGNTTSWMYRNINNWQ